MLGVKIFFSYTKKIQFSYASQKNTGHNLCSFEITNRLNFYIYRLIGIVRQT